jgi:hypothetical protein
MPVPHQSTNFADLLDPRFEKIFFETYDDLPDMLPSLFNFAPDNGRDSMMWSAVGTLGEWPQFEGTVTYDSQSQGYDVTATHVEFASGIQVERKLFDDDQFNIMDQKPRALARSAHRSRQTNGARMLNNAFSVDTLFYSNSEGVALCSNSHTTTSGASTATGFDNLGTAALTATAVAAARIAMVDFRGDRAERIGVTPTELWYPPNLYEQAFEIMGASGKVDTDLNNPNVHHGQYTGKEWNYLTDTNNWFLVDGALRNEHVHWVDRIPMEFAMAEELDTIIAKWRGYMRYSMAHTDWRWVFGSQVS